MVEENLANTVTTVNSVTQALSGVERLSELSNIQLQNIPMEFRNQLDSAFNAPETSNTTTSTTIMNDSTLQGEIKTMTQQNIVTDDTMVQREKVAPTTVVDSLFSETLVNTNTEDLARQINNSGLVQSSFKTELQTSVENKRQVIEAAQLQRLNQLQQINTIHPPMASNLSALAASNTMLQHANMAGLTALPIPQTNDVPMQNNTVNALTFQPGVGFVARPPPQTMEQSLSQMPFIPPQDGDEETEEMTMKQKQKDIRKKRLLKFSRRHLLHLLYTCPHISCDEYPCGCEKSPGSVLWHHIISCNQKPCFIYQCESSKAVLRHYSKCSSTMCPVCNPTRFKLEKMNKSALLKYYHIDANTQNNNKRKSHFTGPRERFENFAFMLGAQEYISPAIKKQKTCTDEQLVSISQPVSTPLRKM